MLGFPLPCRTLLRPVPSLGSETPRDYSAIFRRAILVTVHHRNIRSAGLRTPLGPRVVDINALRALAPPSLRPRPQAITPPAPTPPPLEPQTQRTLASGRADRAPHGCERDARRARRCRQAANDPPGSPGTMPRGAGTTAAAARIGGARRRRIGWGRTARPDGAIPTCARIFRITAGSCSVPIRRSRPRNGHTPEHQSRTPGASKPPSAMSTTGRRRQTAGASVPSSGVGRRGGDLEILFAGSCGIGSWAASV